MVTFFSLHSVFNPCGELFEAVNGVVVERYPVLAECAFVVGGEAAVFGAVRHAEVQVTAGEAVRIVGAFLLAKGEEFWRRKKVGEIVL